MRDEYKGLLCKGCGYSVSNELAAKTNGLCGSCVESVEEGNWYCTPEELKKRRDQPPGSLGYIDKSV